MCKTTSGTQSSTLDSARKIVREGASGGTPSPAPVSSTAFLGKPERVPQIAYIRERPGDGFLTSAKNYYQFFGLNVQDIQSVEEIITHLSSQSGTYQRLLIVSHAHPRGMYIPMFTGGVVGTNKEAFQAFARSDLDGLLLLAPFSTTHNHLFNWEGVMGQCLTAARNHNSSALTPFGLQTSGSPSGQLRDFFKYCFDIVFTREPGRVKRNASQSGGLSAPQRTILINFIGEILTQLGQQLVTGTVTAPQIQALRNALTMIPYNTLGLSADSQFALGLDSENMNDFPTLQAVVVAIQNGFRDKLNTARQRLSEATTLDVRGCRAGEDEEFLEALRQFFGHAGLLPTVTAPRWFQSYRSLGWQTPRDRAQISSWLGSSHWGHSVAELKEKFRTWAEWLRVTPHHTTFWQKKLSGRAIQFAALGWRSEIPDLFIPTPGLEELTELHFSEVIGKLKNYFNVPADSVPSNSTLTSLASLVEQLPTYNQSLLATVADSASAAQLQQLYVGLRTINDAQGQSIVPATAPVPLQVSHIRQYQQQLIEVLETRLAPIKTFMTAAANSLSTGDGLYYYLLFAGLPVYVFGRPEFSKNGLVMLDRHRHRAIQSWYRCLWADPLPTDSGNYRSANISREPARYVPLLVGEDRTSVLSVCPLPRYSNCIRKRPLPAGESDPACESSDLP